MNKFLSRDTPPMFCYQWEVAYDDTRDLDKYAPNWDGAGADPVPFELIQKTLSLFRHLEQMAFPAPDLIYPAADGTVFVEWHHHTGAVQTVNIQPTRVSVVMMDSDGKIIPTTTEVETMTLGVRGMFSDPQDDAFEFTLAA